ncbi:MAG: hypothetical protein HPY81_04600 [Firmicutes bacterium]|nr:hypothetical protein [Bacillota bacterium]
MDEVLFGFGERMKNIAIFQPLFALQNSRKYSEYDCVALGFAVLLFILENMLTGKEACDHQRIGQFLRQVIEANYQRRLSESEGLEMAYYFLDVLRNGGWPFSFAFRDLERGQDTAYKFALIETAAYEIHGQMSFRLTSEGLDLLFKTREIYKELRITISQLYLRQQIEKGVFQEALRTVDDLYVQVSEIHTKLEQMKRRVLRNVSEFSIQAYVGLMEQIYDQLQREKEVFTSLKELLRQTQESYLYRELSEREKQSLDQLMAVSRGLDRVINAHNRLFTHKLATAALLEEAMLDSLANTFRTRLNFEQEFVDRVIEHNADLEVLRQLVQPLFKPNQNRFFNIMRIFDVQQVAREETPEPDALLGPDEVYLQRLAEREVAIKRQRDDRYRKYLELILLPALTSREYSLRDILDRLPPADYAQLVSEVEFYIFLVQVHQLGELTLTIDPGLQERLIDAESGNLPYLLLQVVERYPDLQGLGALEIRVGQEELTLANGSVVSNYYYQVRGRT